MHFLAWIGIVIAALIVVILLISCIIHTTVHKTYSENVNVEGKVVFLTGGTSGIGVHSVIELFLRGMKVTFTGRKFQNVQPIIDKIIKSLKSCKCSP